MTNLVIIRAVTDVIEDMPVYSFVLNNEKLVAKEGDIRVKKVTTTSVAQYFIIKNILKTNKEAPSRTVYLDKTHLINTLQ